MNCSECWKEVCCNCHKKIDFETVASMPWWGWLIIALFVFVYGWLIYDTLKNTGVM